MNESPTSLLCIGVDADTCIALAALGWSVQPAAVAHASQETDVVLLQVGAAANPGANTVGDAASALRQWCSDPALPPSALERPWVILTPFTDSALEADLLRRGVEAVLPWPQASAVELSRQLHHALVRKRLERAARTAYATDLATGLPHQAQLIEHMTQLLALREREPAPMVLLVLRIEGFAQAAAKLGAEAGNVLRRKVAVRLRSGLRASDVVAAMGEDSFGVLLGRLESKSDGERVAGKLLRTLQQPINVAGQPCTVGAAVGMALYPDHGKDADSLIKRASAQAGSVATLGQEGFAMQTHRGVAAAANDGEA